MNEYIFGDLARPDRAASFLRKQRWGVHHHGKMQPLIPQSGDHPLLNVTTQLNRALDGVTCRLTQPETTAIPLELVSTDWDILNWSYIQSWQGRLPSFPDGTVVRYEIYAYPAGGGPIPADDGEPFSYIVGDYRPPPWADEAVIYQIFPDRFHPGSGGTWIQQKDIQGVFGGTLQGIIEGLDHVAGMGFNCIWLNPFHPDETHHGYHATDHYSVNPRLGTLDEMRQLVHRAHALGLRLLLDFVPNHCGAGHPYFQDALSRPDSPYREWFYFTSWPDEYEMYYQIRELPKINVNHPDARAYLLGSVAYWLGDVGFDGLRLDHAHGPALDFWTDLRLEVARVKPDAWLFGEVTLPAPQQMVYVGRFHGCLDFLLAEAIRRTFAFGTMSLAAFDAFLNQHEVYYPAHFSRPSFLDNHDMDRFLYIAGGDKRRLILAALCQFTLSGQPIVYYGTEVGVSQERFINEPDGRGMAEARLPMLWGDDQDEVLKAAYRRLVSLRRGYPALWRGRRRTLHLDDAGDTYAYSREDGHRRAIVALNLSDGPRTIKVAGRSFALAPVSGDVTIMGSEE